MCGIVAVLESNAGVRGETLFEIALSNKHRGDDGVGFVYFDEKMNRTLIRRLPFKLEELAKKELLKERAISRIKVGAVSYLGFDERLYKEKNETFKRFVKPIMERKYHFAILHHRGASVGSVDIRNIHPIILNKRLYFHNGTVEDIAPLRLFMSEYFGVKFKSETDTEVLANALMFLEKKKDSLKRFLTLDFGVILEVCGSQIRIFRTESRRLWYIESKLGKFLVSELNKTVIDKLKPKFIGLVSEGIHKVSEAIPCENYTNEVYKIYKIFSSDEYDDYSRCSICGKEKFALWDDDDSKKKCFECAIIHGLKDPRKKRITSNSKITSYW